MHDFVIRYLDQGIILKSILRNGKQSIVFILQRIVDQKVVSRQHARLLTEIEIQYIFI